MSPVVYRSRRVRLAVLALGFAVGVGAACEAFEGSGGPSDEVEAVSPAAIARAVEMGVAAPASTDGQWWVAWSVKRHASGEALSCGAANASHVVVRATPSSGSARAGSLLFKAPCDRPATQGWIPLAAGSYSIRAELVDAKGAVLSRTHDAPLVIDGSERRHTPFSFRVR
jgi:hypothetical protein